MSTAGEHRKWALLFAFFLLRTCVQDDHVFKVINEILFWEVGIIIKVLSFALNDSLTNSFKLRLVLFIFLVEFLYSFLIGIFLALQVCDHFLDCFNGTRVLCLHVFHPKCNLFVLAWQINHNLFNPILRLGLYFLGTLILIWISHELLLGLLRLSLLLDLLLRRLQLWGLLRLKLLAWTRGWQERTRGGCLHSLWVRWVHVNQLLVPLLILPFIKLLFLSLLWCSGLLG